MHTTVDFDPATDDHWRFGTKKQQLSKPKPGETTVALKVNERLTLTGIPVQALEYVVNGRSALGWLADRYRVHKNKTHDPTVTITNDTNKLFEDPRDYVKLVEQITQMSLATVEIVENLPQEFE